MSNHTAPDTEQPKTLGEIFLDTASLVALAVKKTGLPADVVTDLYKWEMSTQLTYFGNKFTEAANGERITGDGDGNAPDLSVVPDTADG